MWNLFGDKRSAPPIVQSDTVIPLNCFDDNAPVRGYVLRTMLCFDDVLNAEKIKHSLERLLNREGWSKLGARLRLNNDKRLEYHVPTHFDEKRPAFLYAHTDHHMNIAEHPLASKLPHPSTEPAVVSENYQFLPLHTIPGFPTSVEDYLYADIPQLGLYIHSFNDTTLVALSWPHTLSDAMGLGALYNAWSLVLSDRDDEVPPFIGFNTNPFAGFGTDESLKSYKLAKRALSAWQMVVFIVRMVFDLLVYKEQENYCVCMPASTLKRYRETAMVALAAETGKETFLSEGDILCAWWSRYALLHLNHRSSRTVAIMNVFGLRKILSNDLLPASGAYVGNAAIGVNAYFSIREIYESPLHHVALGVRQSILDLGTRDQVEAAAALSRKSHEDKTLPKLYGDATMQLLVFTNWTKAKIFETDFSAAITTKSMTSPLKTDAVAHPSLIQLHCYETPSMPSRNAFGILGKDAKGNYWISGTLKKGLWAKVKQALAEQQYEG